jgi:hypothetical protein
MVMPVHLHHKVVENVGKKPVRGEQLFHLALIVPVRGKKDMGCCSSYLLFEAGVLGPFREPPSRCGG